MVDYAHPQDGIENVLQAITQFVKGDIITVFGCGGDRDNTKRPIMGEVAARYSQQVVVTSDNPRSEEPFGILEQVEVGVKRHTTPYVKSLNCQARAVAIYVSLKQKGILNEVLQNNNLLSKVYTVKENNVQQTLF